MRRSSESLRGGCRLVRQTLTVKRGKSPQIGHARRIAATRAALVASRKREVGGRGLFSHLKLLCQTPVTEMPARKKAGMVRGLIVRAIVFLGRTSMRGQIPYYQHCRISDRAILVIDTFRHRRQQESW